MTVHALALAAALSGALSADMENYAGVLTVADGAVRDEIVAGHRRECFLQATFLIHAYKNMKPRSRSDPAPKPRRLHEISMKLEMDVEAVSLPYSRSVSTSPKTTALEVRIVCLVPKVPEDSCPPMREVSCPPMWEVSFPPPLQNKTSKLNIASTAQTCTTKGE